MILLPLWTGADVLNVLGALWICTLWNLTCHFLSLDTCFAQWNRQLQTDKGRFHFTVWCLALSGVRQILWFPDVYLFNMYVLYMWDMHTYVCVYEEAKGGHWVSCPSVLYSILFTQALGNHVSLYPIPWGWSDNLMLCPLEGCSGLDSGLGTWSIKHFTEWAVSPAQRRLICT